MFILTRESTPADLALQERHQWPVRMTCTYDDAEGETPATPAPVFVMQQAAPGEWLDDSFSCVASVQQMEDLPVDAAGPDGPFFRVSTVTALCRSAAAAVEFGDKVTFAVQDLADNIQAATVLAVESVTIITPYV